MNKGKKYILFLLIALISSECKHGPCDELVNGVYPYPILPENHNMTHEEVNKYYDLPVDICSCITTWGLVETCLNYPQLGLISLSGHDLQTGYNGFLRPIFRGVRELETRPDRGTYLLKKLKSIDPLGYDPNWNPVEIGHYGMNIFF